MVALRRIFVIILGFCAFLFFLSRLTLIHGFFGQDRDISGSQFQSDCRLGASPSYLNQSNVANLPQLPMWSRGFARSCCNVYPKVFGKHNPTPTRDPSMFESILKFLMPWRYRGFFEAGMPDDPQYFFLKRLAAVDTVYVVTPDLASFVSLVFVHLPMTARITLVTGSEDLGAPWEIFHPNRTNYYDFNMKALWPNGQPVTMRQFILDPRLAKWYVQNYDLVGCNSFGCSDIDPRSDALLVGKVEAIPIGVDLHTLSEKQRGADTVSISNSICSQCRDFATALGNSPVPFQHRRLAVYAAFDCTFSKQPDSKASGAWYRSSDGCLSRSAYRRSCVVVRTVTRGPLCALLDKHRSDERYQAPDALGHNASVGSSSRKSGGKINRRLSQRSAKILFWRSIADYAFSFAPTGYGVDTHRVWEILQMRTVPIVITSTLDTLYRQFPIIIVNDWQEAFLPGALERYREEIVSKYGGDPFSPRVLEKLTMQYWVDRVRNGTLQG